MNKKVAVLLASYNGSKYIKQQIDSILMQKEVNITIFISDDLSLDNTLEYLRNTYRNHRNLIYLESNRKFGGAASNFYRLIQDVDFADYDFIAFADQDDIWHQEKITRALRIIKQKQLDGYSSNVVAFWENGKKS